MADAGAKAEAEKKCEVFVANGMNGSNECGEGEFEQQVIL